MAHFIELNLKNETGKSLLVNLEHVGAITWTREDTELFIQGVKFLVKECPDSIFEKWNSALGEQKPDLPDSD